MSKSFEDEYREKIIDYAEKHNMIHHLPSARLVALNVIRSADVGINDVDDVHHFEVLEKMIYHARSAGFLSIVGPDAGPPFVVLPPPVSTNSGRCHVTSDDQLKKLIDEIKSLTTTNKRFSTRISNLNAELKTTRFDNEQLRALVDRLSSGEELKALQLSTQKLSREVSSLTSDKTALSADLSRIRKERLALQSERDRLLDEVESLRSSKERLSLENDELVTKARVFGYFKIALVFVLALALTMGVHFRNQFHALESDFNDRLTSAELRITEAEDRVEDEEALVRIAESKAARATSRAEDAEEKLAESESLVEVLLTQLEEQNKQATNNSSASGNNSSSSGNNSSDSDNSSESSGSQTENEPDINEKLAEQAEKIKEMMDELDKRQGELDDSQEESGQSSGVSSSSGSSSNPGSSSGSASTDENTATSSYTVYITEYGTKYHLGSCSYLSKSKIAIDRSKAIAQGYTACSRCKP